MERGLWPVDRGEQSEAQTKQKTQHQKPHTQPYSPTKQHPAWKGTNKPGKPRNDHSRANTITGNLAATAVQSWQSTWLLKLQVPL